MAAAGEDKTYGLPGVGETSRTPQATASLNRLCVISTITDPHASIRSSRWASRGWTFQEAVLSRRCLFFTDQQMYFECNSMSCFESIYSPLDKLHVKDRSRVRDGKRAAICAIAPYAQGVSGRRSHCCAGSLFIGHTGLLFQRSEI